jgi:hypothetical protein
MPHIYLANDALRAAREQSSVDPSRRVTITNKRDNVIVNALWYFREDVQINSFHLNYQMIYPFTGISQKADRSGELFYFTHHSHLAR